MWRWIVTLLIAGVLLPAIVAEPALAEGKSRCEKRAKKTDKEITEFIYDVTIPWPFRKHAAASPAQALGDADGDGVSDDVDQCPGTPKGATVDAKGCPADEDGDGVYDGLDQCPGTPKGTDVDSKGCPVSKVEKALLDTGIFTTTEILFDYNSAVIKPASYKLLDEIGAVLAAHPELKVEIGGHTDSKGSDGYNQKLSERRAQAVLEYLTKKFSGIGDNQLFPKGYGESKPVASNDTDEGRAQNRRVEFRVLQK